VNSRRDNSAVAILSAVNLEGLIALSTFSINDESEERPRAINGIASYSRFRFPVSLLSTILKNSFAN
jgi:hypothetical protein